jgi:uncharacterized metal-binding protein YceD (DUF177 family)
MSIKFIVNLAKVGAKNNYSSTANPEELLELVDILEVEKVLSLSYKVEISKLSNIKFKILGNIKAKLVQSCSISSDFIDVDKSVDFVRFIEQVSKNNQFKKEEVIDINDEDIDYIQGNELDLSTMVIEELILNIDPFIKKDSI